MQNPVQLVQWAGKLTATWLRSSQLGRSCRQLSGPRWLISFGGEGITRQGGRSATPRAHWSPLAAIRRIQDIMRWVADFGDRVGKIELLGVYSKGFTVSMTPRKKRVALWLGIGCGAYLVLMGIFVVSAAVYRSRQSEGATSWPTVEGIITSSACEREWCDA